MNCNWIEQTPAIGDRLTCSACGRVVTYRGAEILAWCKASPEPRPRPEHRPAITLADQLRAWAGPNYIPEAIDAAVARLAICQATCLAAGQVQLCPDFSAWSCRGMRPWFARLVVGTCPNLPM